VGDARTPETRARRVEMVMNMLRAGKK